MKTILFRKEGPMLRYRIGRLEISDLNPECRLIWSVTRVEAMKIAFRLLVAALRRATEAQTIMEKANG